MKKFNLAYLFTFLSIIVNIIFYWLGIYDPLEQNLYDLRFQLRGPLSGDNIYDESNQLKKINQNLDNKAIKKDYSKDNDIVIIGLDQASYTNIGRFYPYDRGLIWAKVVDNLVDANISVIAFDIMFDNQTLSDSIFSKSIKNANAKGVSVILAANNMIETGIAGKNFSLIKPSKDIINGNDIYLGLVGTVSDKDGFIRKYIAYDPNVNDSYQENYFSLSLQSVISYKKSTPIVNNNGIYIDDSFIPFYENENTFLINYFGPSSYGRLKTFNTIPLHEILDDGSCYPEEGDCEPILKNHDEIDGFMELFTMDEWDGVNPFAGKIAIIGSALQEHHDMFNTPYNNNGEMYGVEIHANVIQQILDNNHINNPISFLCICASIFILTVGVIAGGLIKFSFFPPIEADLAIASIEYPKGTSIELTRKGYNQLENATEILEDELKKEFPGEVIIKNRLSTIGFQPMRTKTSRGPGNLTGSYGGSNMAEVALELVPGEDRKIGSEEVVRRWREIMPKVIGVESISFFSSLFSAGDPINIQLSSNYLDDLISAKDKLKLELAQYPGVFDITDNFTKGKEELVISLLPVAKNYGINMMMVANQVRQAFFGLEVQSIQRGRNEVKIMLRYPESDRKSISNLENMMIISCYQYTLYLQSIRHLISLFDQKTHAIVVFALYYRIQ